MAGTQSFFYFQTLIILSAIVLMFKFNMLAICIIPIISVGFLCWRKITVKQWLLLIGAVAVIIPICFLVPDNWNFKSLSSFLSNQYGNLYLRNIAINHLDEIYDFRTTELIKLLIFNEKQYTSQTYLTYQNLGLLHLFVASGLHVSIITSLVSKFFRNHKKVASAINLVPVIIIWVLGNFSASILRIILLLTINLFSKPNKLSSFHKNCIVGIIICIFFVREAMSYSFILTMMCTLTINFMSNKIKTTWVLLVYINVVLFALTAPITISFNDQLNPFAALNSIAFSWFLLLVYFLELILCWFPFLTKVNGSVLSVIQEYFSNLSKIEPLIAVKIPPYIILGIYTGIFFFINYQAQQDFLNNKITINYNNLYVSKK